VDAAWSRDWIGEMIFYDPKNWMGVLLDFPRSPVFRTLFLDVIGAGLYAALVVWVETDYFRVAVPLGPSFLSILGIILGLLLVFRTNTAYDRWWEGRRLWGQLVNVSRGLAHALDAQLAPTDDARRTQYASLLGAFPAVLATHLRMPREILPDGTVADAKPRRNAPPAAATTSEPNRLVQSIHRTVMRDIDAGVLPTEARIALQPLLSAFDDITGACERIRNTPIPFSYSSYIKQFVLLYALVLPFGLVKEFGYGTVIASMFTFFATMGLELLAGEIEEPFGTDRNDLPLDQIAGRIEADVHTLLLAPVPSTPQGQTP
jgi:ion channel-forming bestrophin family protein